jgi:hypothetical protein
MIISHVKMIAFQLSFFCKNYCFSKIVSYIINRLEKYMGAWKYQIYLVITTHFCLRISLICAFRIFSRFRTAPFQVFINTSVIQDKTLTIYINFGKFKLEKAPNFVTRPASNVDRRTPFGSEKKCGMHISVKCVVKISETC